MKPVSLSMRLGLTVSMMGAVLVVFLAVLAYLALSHELDSRAKDSLEKTDEPDRAQPTVWISVLLRLVKNLMLC